MSELCSMEAITVPPLRKLQTGTCLQPRFATSPPNSHPNILHLDPSFKNLRVRVRCLCHRRYLAEVTRKFPRNRWVVTNPRSKPAHKRPQDHHLLQFVFRPLCRTRWAITTPSNSKKKKKRKKNPHAKKENEITPRTLRQLPKPQFHLFQRGRRRQRAMKSTVPEQ